MKKIILLFLMVMSPLLTFSQSSDAFSYQSVLRDANGNIISSRNVLVEATGENIYLRLRGRDGLPGRDGGRGNDGFNCWQKRGEWNMVGASGGNGGSGGKGGNGSRVGKDCGGRKGET